MSAKLSGASLRVARFLASRLFWRIIFGFFLFEAVWFVFSAQYPMAFDENFHFGLIQLHAKQWLPFFTSQPPDAGTYGAAVRDPSYLYHWLLSLLYRPMSVVVHSQTKQILLLRLVNVALFAVALLLYRRLMRRVGLSNAYTNVALLALVLIPVVPFLAATINYDNLFMVFVPAVSLLTLDVLAAFSNRQLPLAQLMVLGSLVLLGSLVKYPFLPVLLVVALYLIWRAWRDKLFAASVWRSAWISLRRLGWIRQALLVALLVLSLGLFCERYVSNAVHYHTPVPKCNEVISQDECLEYGPWARDYGLANSKSPAFRPNIVAYTGEWFNGMWYRLFFAITYTYANNPPLFVISRLAIVLAVLLSAGILLRARRLFVGHHDRALLLLLVLGYGVVLFADNYAEYRNTAVAVAINGRYWIPFLPFVFALGGLAWSDILRRQPAVKVWTTVVVLAIFLLQGGGTMTYIVRSQDYWYWPNPLVRRVNGDIRKVVSPFILGKSIT